MLGFNIFVIFLLILLVGFVMAGVKIVPQGYNYTVERFGRYVRTLDAGLGLIVPFVGIKAIDMLLSALHLT